MSVVVYLFCLCGFVCLVMIYAYIYALACVCDGLRCTTCIIIHVHVQMTIWQACTILCTAKVAKG